MLRFKTVILAFAMGVGLLCNPTVAKAQCTNGMLEVYLDNEDRTDGHIVAAGTTGTGYNSNCPGQFGGQWRVEVWFLNQPWYPSCYPNGPGNTGGLENGACVATSPNVTNPTHHAYVVADLRLYGCKPSRSRHWNVNGAWTFVGEIGGPGSNACGGNPPPDPSTEECHYYWNEELQEWTMDWCPSPIILPVGKDKKILMRKDYKLTDAKHGVSFDIDGDGDQDVIGWTHQNSNLAFLALDRNGNGRIDSGKELFGNFTHPGKSNGFAALLVDSNNAGMIMEGHPLYEQLLLWEDRNHNGYSEPEEISKFSEQYVGLDGSYTPDKLVDKYGNQFRFKGSAVLRVEGASKKYPEPSAPGEDYRRYGVDIWDVFFTTK